MVKFSWDKLKRFLAQANTWTGQQTFSNIAITGGTIGGATITENLTTSTNPAANAAVTTAIVNSHNGVVVTLTAEGNTQTIQSPTTAATIRKFMVVNNDTSTHNLPVVANSVTFTLTPGEGQCFIWDGTAWGPTDLGITDIPVLTTQGGTGRATGTTAYALVATGTTATGAQQTLANGATTEVLVGGGASALPVWTTATGSGAPVRATSPTLVTPVLGTPTSGDLKNCSAATTTTNGVVELATVAETVAGTSTTLTPTCDGVAAAVAVLAREPSQGINMTAATSGSNGIAVADDDDIDYGTGNFFGVIPVLLADYTPSAEVVLEQKTDGTNGREFTLQTNGKLRVTINTTDYDSTVATGCTDNTKHVFGYSVTRETAAAAGSIIFVVDGVQLGDAVAITAGAPTTINNAVSQYVLGTSATRTAGTVNGYISGNRALTAAEHLALYRNGIAEADKWGSQTAVYTSDFSAGADSWIAINGIVAGNTDSIEGVDDCLKYYCDSSNGGHYIGNKILVTNYGLGKKWRMVFDYYIPTGQTNVNSISVTNGVTDTIFGTVGAWTHVDAIITQTSVNLTPRFNARNSSVGVIFTGAGSADDDRFYIKNLSFTQVGATLALEPEGINETNWQDSSTNNLDAIYPTTGWSLTRKVTTADLTAPGPIGGTTPSTGAFTGLTLSDAGKITLDIAPASDHTATGIQFSATAGEAVAYGNVCCLKSDGKYWKIDADAAATMPATVMALATIAGDAAGNFLDYGWARDDSWSWTIGGMVYASTDSGGLTQTAPSGEADNIQIVGKAETATVLKFAPSWITAEVGLDVVNLGTATPTTITFAEMSAVPKTWMADHSSDQTITFAAPTAADVGKRFTILKNGTGAGKLIVDAPSGVYLHSAAASSGDGGTAYLAASARGSMTWFVASATEIQLLNADGTVTFT